MDIFLILLLWGSSIVVNFIFFDILVKNQKTILDEIERLKNK